MTTLAQWKHTERKNPQQKYYIHTKMCPQNRKEKIGPTQYAAKKQKAEPSNEAEVKLATLYM